MRRTLGPRQSQTIDRLLAAVETELSSSEYDGVTMRTIAQTAGVSAATAYTYFTSKDHLVAELLWRRYQNVHDPMEETAPTVLERVVAVLSTFALLVADEPRLARACSLALIADDADVHILRDLIGAETHQRLVRAGGSELSSEMIFTLELLVSGALIRAGTGHIPYHDLPKQLATSAALLLRGIS